MCTRQRTASLKSFSLGNMHDKACLVLDLRELRPRHQVTAHGVPGQDAKQLGRLVAGKSQPASGPKPQGTRRRGWWWRRSHRQIRRQKTTSLCLKVSKELWQGGKGGDSTQTLQLHGHLGKLSSSYAAMVTACNTLTYHKLMHFSKAASPTENWCRKNITVSIPGKGWLAAGLSIEITLNACGPQRHKRSISDRSINIKVNVHWEDRIPSSNDVKQIKYCELAEESRTADWVATISLRWDAGALSRSWRYICWRSRESKLLVVTAKKGEGVKWSSPEGSASGVGRETSMHSHHPTPGDVRGE